MKIFNRKEQIVHKLRQDYYKNKVNEQARREKIEHLPNHEDSFVCLNNVQKIYPNGYYSVVDFNLDIKEGEFMGSLCCIFQHHVFLRLLMVYLNQMEQHFLQCPFPKNLLAVLKKRTLHLLIRHTLKF